MKYVLVLILLLSPMKSRSQDDVLLAAAAQWMTYIINEVKTVGEQFLAELRKRTITSQIRAQKEGAKEISIALAESAALKIELANERDIGSGKIIYATVENANGGLTPVRLMVSGIAPSACFAFNKSKINKSLEVQKEEVAITVKQIIEDNYSVNKTFDNHKQKSERKRELNTLITGDDNFLVPLFPSFDVIIEPTDHNIKLATAKAIKFAYSNDDLPVDMKDMDEDELFRRISSAKGQDWLTYYFAAEAVFDVVYSTIADNFTVENENGAKTSVAIERERDYQYAASFKRTLANQVKYNAGSIMELNHLGNSLLNAKLDENHNLRKERKLLLIMAIKRLRRLRSDM